MCMRVWRGAVEQSIKGEDGVLYVVRARGLIETAFLVFFFGLSCFVIYNLSSIQYFKLSKCIALRCSYLSLTHTHITTHRLDLMTN